MNGNVEYVYLHESSISEDTYLEFLRKYYGERAEYRLYKRYVWYNRYLGFHCLLAILDGSIVGQSCAFRVLMMTPEGEQEWWWGCDSFVLEASRGHGVGKGMQKKLFADHPNFSSLGYSNTNGHIKKKMGANVIAKTYPSLYPISRWASVWILMAYMKLTGKRNVRKLPLPYIPLYKWINSSSLKGFTINETTFTDENVSFIDKILSKKYDLYVIRDKEYLSWKYNENPSVQYHLLEVRKENKLEAVIAFSIAYDGEFVSCPLKLCKLYDVFIEPSSNLMVRDAIYVVSKYYTDRGEKIEGVTGILNANYKFAIRYPNKGKELLTSSDLKVDAPYFSNSDQDLDQIRALEY